MGDNVSADTKRIIGQSIKTFGNLLKEFPKTAADEFVYDDSTLRKIGEASISLQLWINLLGQKTDPLDENIQAAIKSSHKSLTQLMEELPKDSSDEFWYDRTIHQMVEEARNTIDKLNQIF